MTASLRLYETVNDLNAVREWIYEHDAEIRETEGAIPDELALLLERAETDFESKAESVALFVRELLANAVAVEQERDRLDARVRHYKRAAESLKAYLKYQLERAEITSVKGKLVTVRVQRNPIAVRTLLNQDTLSRMKEDPETADFIERIPESYRVNGDAVRVAVKEGKALPAGIEVVQSSHLRIV